MDLFKVDISPTARKRLERYVDYIQFTLLNDQAADAVMQDALETIEDLEKTAESLGLCTDPDLEAMGYRKILFRRHDYVMIYDIDGHTARIKGVYHLLQDYENLFMKQIQ